MWSEKYRPTRIDHLIGNEEARLVLSAWLSRWKPGTKAALLMGPPGTGKTTLVNLLAKEQEMNLVDLNASDVRTKEKLRGRMGEAMSTVSLFGERSLIFLDEVDGLAGRSDYGAVEFIKESVKESQNPIVMAANDPDSDEIKKLASSCLAIRFRPPPPREVEMYLREIARREGVPIDDDEELRTFVRDAAGDVRQAINLLQSNMSKLSVGVRRQASAGQPGGSLRSDHYKDRESSVSEALAGFFGAADKAGGCPRPQEALAHSDGEDQGDPQDDGEVWPRTGRPGQGARGRSRCRPPHGQDDEERQLEAPQVPRQAAGRGPLPHRQGRRHQIHRPGRPPVPHAPPHLERLEEDPRALPQVRREGAHQRDERALARPALTSSRSAQARGSGRSWSAGSTSTRPTTSSCRRRRKVVSGVVRRRILVGGWFSLPVVGRDVFSRLMKQGVVYDKTMGFKFDSGTDIRAAVQDAQLCHRGWRSS